MSPFPFFDAYWYTCRAHMVDKVFTVCHLNVRLYLLLTCYFFGRLFFIPVVFIWLVFFRSHWESFGEFHDRSSKSTHGRWFQLVSSHFIIDFSYFAWLQLLLPRISGKQGFRYSTCAPSLYVWLDSPLVTDSHGGQRSSSFVPTYWGPTQAPVYIDHRQVRFLPSRFILSSPLMHIATGRTW